MFAGITVTKEVSAHPARSSLEDKIFAYTKGQYPEVVKKGYGVEVLEIREKVVLGFLYPDGEGYPSPHPLSNQIFDAKATRFLNDNGLIGNQWGQTRLIFAAKLYTVCILFNRRGQLGPFAQIWINRMAFT